MKLISRLRWALIILGVVAFPQWSPCDNASPTVRITKSAPLEALSPAGDLIGVSEATAGTRYTLVNASGQKLILKDAKGNQYRISISATDYTVPSLTAASATNAAGQPASIAAEGNAAAPSPKPIQLQFTAPDSRQEDLIGNVKSVDEKSYKLVDGLKGNSTDASLTTFNAQGCELEESKWDKDGNLDRKKVTSYDANGNVLGSKDLGADGSIISTWTLAFDPATRTTTADSHASDGTLKERNVTVYDKWGKESLIKHFDAQGNLLESTTMQRNADGKEVTVVFYGPGDQPRTTISLEWNPDGSQASESFSANEKGISSRTTYEYPDHDLHGNWTARNGRSVFQKDGQTLFEVDSVTERLISYY